MNILISNDDGYLADGLVTLYNKLKKNHNVLVVAPDSERSAYSHMMTLKRKLMVNKISDDIYALSGSPVDCVKFALQYLKFKPDIVFGGINRGCNVSSDVMYSGTCAVAREATYLGYKGVALSLDYGDEFDYTKASEFISNNLENFCNNVEKKSFWSVNFPNGVDFKEPKFCYFGEVVFSELFNLQEDGSFFIEGKPTKDIKTPNMDVTLLHNGHITITPVFPYLEDVEMIEKLNKRMKFI